MHARTTYRPFARDSEFHVAAFAVPGETKFPFIFCFSFISFLFLSGEEGKKLDYFADKRVSLTGDRRSGSFTCTVVPGLACPGLSGPPTSSQPN